MVGPGVSEVEARFSKLRRSLDDGGYLESFGLDSLRLVEHLFGDLLKTTESLQKTLEEYAHYKRVADELENGVAPFKEENIRLNKENSKLRMGIARAIEEADDKARDPLSRVRDLEAENNDLKLLASQFAERVKKSDIEVLEKTKRIEKLQEKMLTANIVVTERNKRIMSQPCKQSMEVDYFVPDACPQCIRLRNFAEYNKTSDRNPKAVDYMKLADSRIEALQLQLRSLKNAEKEHLSMIASLKNRVDTRETEIEKLRELIRIRPGRDNFANALDYDKRNDKMERNVVVGLKAAEMQLQILQRRNIELEDKLKKSILQEHEDFMLGKLSNNFGMPNVPSGFLEKELDKYPSHDKMSLLEKLYYLERQLSHCCKEKAVLKNLLEECRLKHKNSQLHDEDKDIVLKKSSLGRSPKRFILNRRTDASVRFSQQKPSLSKPTIKTLGHQKQMTRPTISAQRKLGDKSSHVAKVSTKLKNVKKMQHINDIEEESVTLESVSENDDEDDEEVSCENEVDSQLSSMDDTDGEELDERNIDGLKGKKGYQKLARERKLSHDVMNNVQLKHHVPPVKNIKGKREPQFMPSSQNDYARKTSEMETGEMKYRHTKGSLQTQSVTEARKFHKQQRDIIDNKSSALLNSKKHIEEMDAIGYQSDEYAYFDSEEEAESDDQHSDEDDALDQIMEHDIATATTERQSRSKGERALMNKYARKNLNPKDSKAKKDLSGKKQSLTSKATTANQSRQPGAALYTTDPMGKTHSEGVRKSGARQISNVNPVGRLRSQGVHPDAKPSARGGSRFRTAPNRAGGKAESMIDENGDKYAERELDNASSDELSDEFYVSDEELESENGSRARNHHEANHGVNKRAGRAGTKENGNRDFQRSVEPSYFDEENTSHLKGERGPRYKDSKLDNARKSVYTGPIPENNRETEREALKLDSQQAVKRSDQQTTKAKYSDPQTLKRGNQQAMKDRDPQTLNRGDQQAMNHRDPQTLKRGDQQAMKDRDPQTLNRGDQQTMKHRDPQTLKRGDQQAMKHRDPQTLNRGDQQAMKDRDPQTLKRGDQQAMKHRDPQTMKHSDPQTLKRGDQQTMKHSDPQTLKRGDQQAKIRNDTQPSKKYNDPHTTKRDDAKGIKQGDSKAKRGEPKALKQSDTNKSVGVSRSSSQPRVSNIDKPTKRGTGGNIIPFSEDGNYFDQDYAPKDDAASSAESDIMEDPIPPQPSYSKSELKDFEDQEIALGAAGDSVESMSRKREMSNEPQSQKLANRNMNAPGMESIHANPVYRKEGGQRTTSDFKRTVSIDMVQDETSSGIKTSSNNPLTAATQRQQQRYVSGSQDSGPQYSRHGDNGKEDKYLYTDDKSKHGISAVEQPSLLSISGLEGNPNDNDEDNITNRRFPVGNPMKSNNEQERYANPRRLPAYDAQEQEATLARKQPGTSYPERKNEFEPQNPYSDTSSKPSRAQGQLSFDRERAPVTEQYFREPSRNLRKDQVGVADIEFNRAGDTDADATASYGEISDASFSRDPKRSGLDLGNRGGVKRGETSYAASHSKSTYDDRSRFGPIGFDNPRGQNRAYEESRNNMRSVGVNTENYRTGLPPLDRGDSQEKKTLLEKVGVLQRKLDELHTDSSRHQLKSFELQGELERTKHMLQVEKQERDLATSELRRLREQHNESTARMLMNSAIGSDGSFRRGTTPMELEREIVNLRAALSSLDRDKDEMRVELDRKDEKLARISNDASKFVDEISQLKLRLKNAELQINHTGESAKEQGREVEFLKKQLESNRRDLEKTIRERDDSLKELHKLSGAHVKGQMERRGVETELEVKSKEADDLRRQVQRYIDEVRRIEELLLDKEEEMEMLIQHYRSLTAENNNLEAQRTSLEREASSIRDSVRDTVDQNISYKTQLASQNALVSSLEEEIQRLTQQISQLENQASTSMEKEKMLESDTKASKDLLYRLEIQMDKLKLDFADCDSKRKQLEAENSELTEHIASLESRLLEETGRQQQLETLVANSREKDFQLEKTTLDISRERDELTGKLMNLQQRSESLNTEVSRYRLKSIELQNELDRTRRQLDSEKRERETALSELRRVRDQLSSSSAINLLNTALGGSSGSQLLTDSSLRQTGSTSGSTFRHNITSEVAQRNSREQSPLTTPYTPGSDLQLDTPIAASTTRPPEQFRRDQTGDEFDAWDSPK